MKNIDKIKQAVLDQVFQSCQDDGDYLYNLIEWAHKDYTEQDYLDDYDTMRLFEKEGETEND
jgi:hypothetical protein